MPSKCVLRDRWRPCKRELPCETSDPKFIAAVKCWGCVTNKIQGRISQR